MAWPWQLAREVLNSQSPLQGNLSINLIEKAAGQQGVEFI